MPMVVLRSEVMLQCVWLLARALAERMRSECLWRLMHLGIEKRRGDALDAAQKKPGLLEAGCLITEGEMLDRKLRDV